MQSPNAKPLEMLLGKLPWLINTTNWGGHVRLSTSVNWFCEAVDRDCLD
jgi:hypothetical protein